MARYGPGTQLTPQQVYAVARQAGFSPGEAVYATAIALAESSGITNNWNNQPPDNSYGLWQVNRGVNNELGGRGTPDQLVDPLYNAQVALNLARTPRSWNHWSVYLNGAYRQYLGAAQQAAAEVGDDQVGNLVAQSRAQAGAGGGMMDDDLGPVGGLPGLQGGGGLGLPNIGGTGGSAIESLPTDAEGYYLNPTTLARHTYLGSGGARYFLRQSASGAGTDLVPIGATGQAATTVRPITVAKGAIAVMPDGRIISNTSGAGGVAGNTVLGANQSLVGPTGSVLASNPAGPTVLGQGQMQVGPGGQIQAQNPALSPEQIALKQQELNQAYQVQMAEAQRRWQTDRDDNAYKMAVAAVDSWYKNESLRNTRLVAAQSAAVQDRQMAQPMMFGAGTPYGTVVLPSALVGSAFSGQWGPAYEDSGAWGQPPNVQEAFKNAGGGVQNQWPQILQPQTAPTIQGQQPTGQPRPTPQLTAASAIGASDVTAAPNSPTPSQPVGNLDVDFPPGSLPTPASDPYAADAAMNPASPGGQPAGGQGGPRTFTAPPLVSGSISGGFPYGAMYPPGTDRSRQFTAPPLVSGSISGGFPRGYMYPSQQGGTAGGAAAGGAGKTPVTSTVQQHDDGQWWKDTQWSDDSWTYEPASDPYSADVGYNAAAPTPPAATPTASPTGSNSISGAYPRGYMYPGGSQGGGWPSMPWSWDDIGNAAGNLFGGRSSVPNDGRNVMERVAHPQGEQWDDTRRTWVRPDGTYWDPNSGTWHGPAGGGEWDFGSGQGDPMEDLAALGAGPQLGQPPVPPPGGSMSPVPPEAVVGQGNQFGEPVSNETPYHKGVDYQAAEGTPAQAPVTGTVVYVGERGDLGLSVVIQDEAGQSHELNHLADANVQVGDPVQAGQPVGQVGSTGASTGAHLDYRVRGQNGDFTDPNALPGVGDVLGGMPDMEGMPQDELNPGSGQGEGWGYGPPRAPSNPWALSAPDDQYPTNMTGWANTPIGAGGGDPWAFGSGQGEGEEVVYYADGGRVIRKTTWGGDESSAVYEDTGMATQAPDGTASQSAEGLAGQGTAAQPTAPAATSTAAAATPTANASSSSRVYQTKNGARTEAQMEQELRNAGWPGGESVVDAYARTTGGNVSTAPGTTNPAAAQRARGPFTTQSQNGWEFVYDADGNLVSYQPRYNPAQADTEGGWNLKLQESAQAAAAELAKQRAQAERDVAGITGRSNVLATWGRTAAGSPWISRLTGRSPAPGDLGSPEASGGFGWPPPQSQQSAQLLQNITGPAQSPTSGSWQDAVPGATSGAYSQKALGWEDLVGSGAGDWSDYANVDQQYEGMESGWPSPPSADEFTNLGPFGQSAMRYGMESAGVPWRPWADAMLGAWRQTNQQAPTGLSGWAPRNVSRLGYDVASPTTKAQYSNEAELFMPVSDWLEKEQRRWQPTEARTAYAA